MTRKLRKQRKTLLIVGEGQTEHAFLKYLVSLFCRDKQGPKATVENAHGKGPENILNTAIRIKRRASYDKTVAVLDTDIPWTQSLKREARSNKELLEHHCNEPQKIEELRRLLNFYKG